MTDTEKHDDRPFWKKRRFIGGVITGLGGIIALAPGAPIAFAIGTLPVTWNMVGLTISWVGTNFFSWGLGKAQERDNH